MRVLVIYAYLLTSLFYFSEGKPCPEKTRQHKTRCDAYYKCRELSSNSHVWVPTKCSEGLVYEHKMGLCVLPGEDWECITPSELANPSKSAEFPQADANILIVNDMAPLAHQNEQLLDDDSVKIVLDASLSSEESHDQEVLEQDRRPPQEDHHFDSSGDGELVELDGALPVQNRESDPAVEKLKAELKQVQGVSESSKPGSPIDPNLTAHLQRLSQLIDGLQQKYQKTDKPEVEMRPDQLNAFLAHFKIKNHFDQLTPEGNYKDAGDTNDGTTPKPLESTTTSISSTTMTTKLPEASPNKTSLQEHLNKNRMQPETKLMLSNTLPFSMHGTSSSGSGYANSQIVVNRPEGSVMFALPPGPSSYGMSNEQNMPSYHTSQSHEYNEHSEPKISEDTLKTVLELSKQMIAAQNVPKVLPNPGYAYAQPILQPVFISPHGGNPFQQYYAPSPMSYVPPQHKKHGNGGYSSKPSTTIIHNNVIPVHLSSTNSGEKEVLDTYGNSLGMYPSLDKHATADYMTTARPTLSQLTTMASLYDSPYGQQDFTLTTPRPFEQQPSAATVSTYYTPSPHLNEHNVNRIFQSATESYPTNLNLPRPMMDMFPSQLEPGQVKIRPNSQKIESMEVLDAAGMGNDDMIKANYMNVNQSPHVLTYSSSNGGSGSVSSSSDILGMGQQLAPPSSSSSSYMDHQQQQQQQHQFHSLSPYLARPTPTISSSIYSDSAGNMELNMFSSNPQPSMNLYNKLKYPSQNGGGGGGGGGQLVNFNGNFISLDVFQKSILPLMTKSSAAMSELGNVEVITCQAGVRQPNQTDCTRYFVCSKKDGKVLSYSCPPYTGFNSQTRICDAQTYAQCGNMPIFNGYSIDANRRLQMETLKMLSEAKRRQEAALKAQSIAALLQQYGQSSSPTVGPSLASLSMIQPNIEQDAMDSYVVNLPDITTTTMRPILPPISNIGNGSPLSPSSPSSSSSSSGNVKKRKYYCKEGDKIPDQTSISSYFVCYKNAQGQMKGHKMTCSKSLLFCPKTLMCTLASKCTG